MPASASLPMKRKRKSRAQGPGQTDHGGGEQSLNHVTIVFGSRAAIPATIQPIQTFSYKLMKKYYFYS